MKSKFKLGLGKGKSEDHKISFVSIKKLMTFKTFTINFYTITILYKISNLAVNHQIIYIYTILKINFLSTLDSKLSVLCLIQREFQFIKINIPYNEYKVN